MKASLISATSLGALLAALAPVGAQAGPYFSLSGSGGVSCSNSSSSAGCTLTFYALPGQSAVTETVTMTAGSSKLNGGDTFNAAPAGYSGTSNTTQVVAANSTLASNPYGFTGASSAGPSGLLATSPGTTTVSGATLSTKQTSTLTFQGYTVAPIQSVANGSAGYVLVSPTGNSTGTANVTVGDVGAGNLAGTGGNYNLNGSINAFTPSNQFTGPGSAQSISLTDANNTTSGATTATSIYTFAPTIRGAQSATTTVTFTNGNSSGSNVGQLVIATLVGTGVAPVQSVGVANAAGVGGSSNTGNLGYVLVNGGTASASVTLSNQGNGNLAGSGGAYNLNGSVTAVSGSGYSGSTTPATVSLNDTNYQAAGATLSAGYTYTFAPTVRGTASTVVTSSFSNGSNDNTNNSQTVASTITGQGVAPVQTTTSSGLTNPAATASAAYVLVGSTQTATATVTLTNVGNGNLAGSGGAYNLNGSVSIAGGGFSGTGTVSLNDSNYAGGGPTISQTVTYVFQPTVTGAATGVGTVAYTNGNSDNTNTAQTLNYTYTGTGVAPVVTMSGGGNYALVGNSASVLVTVQNTGNGNLSGAGTISNLQGVIASASSGDAALFSGSSVALGGGTGLGDTSSTTVSYVFKPTTVGTFSTDVSGTFTNGTTNTNAGGTETATLTGTGVAPVANVSSTSAGYVLVNSSTTTTVTVTNTGNGDLAGNDISNGGSLATNLHGTQGAASSSVFTGGGGTINLQDSNATTGTGFPSTGSTTATFTYNFAPTSIGGASTAVTSTFANGVGPTNATGTYTATLTGTGVAPIQTITASTLGNNGYVLVQQTAAATITVANVGNGNLAGSGGAFNLNGSITNVTGNQFTGGVTTPTSSVSLNDSTYVGGGATITQTYNYTFAPTMRGASTTTLTGSFSNGSNNGVVGSTLQGYNQAQTASVTLAGTGVAPVNSVAIANAAGQSGSANTGNLGYVLVNSGTASATVTVGNIGNGNLSGLGSISNLNGSVSSVNGSQYAGSSGGSVSLADTTSVAAASTTATYTYSFAPTIRGTSTTIVTTSFSNGSADGYNNSATVTNTITGTGVAPVNSVTSTNAGDVRIGGTATATVTVNNIGDGNLATGGPSSISNLNATSISGPSTGTQWSGSVSNPSSVSLADNNSTVLNYVFAPTTRGVSNTTVAVNFSNGDTSGQNLSQTVSSTLTGTGVGPLYKSPNYGFTNNGSTVTGGTVNSGSSGFNTPIANNGTTSAPAIQFGDITVANTTGNQVEILLDISNLTPDSADGTNTELSLLSDSIFGGNDPTAFSVGSFTNGNILQVDDSTYLQLFAYDTLGSGGGSEFAYLTITTDENAPYGVTGDTFTYELSALALNSSTVPEPTSLALLGVGLLGLGWTYRRRKQQAKVTAE